MYGTCTKEILSRIFRPVKSTPLQRVASLMTKVSFPFVSSSASRVGILRAVMINLPHYQSIQNRVLDGEVRGTIIIQFEDVLRHVFHKHTSLRIDVEQITHSDWFRCGYVWLRLKFLDVVHTEGNRPVGWKKIYRTLSDATKFDLQFSDEIVVWYERRRETPSTISSFKNGTSGSTPTNSPEKLLRNNNISIRQDF